MDNELTEEMVRQYLVENGDFLQRNPELMDHLHITHASAGSAVSLVEKQVSVLRERNVEMRRRLSTLTSNAKENDALFQHTSALVLRLLEASSTGELCKSFNSALCQDFGVDYAAVILFGEAGDNSGARFEDPQQARNQVGALLRGGATCGALRQEQLQFLFPEAGSTGSAAVVPLGAQAEYGLVAVGSPDAARYSNDMDTLFLDHLAQVILRLLPRLQQAQAA